MSFHAFSCKSLESELSASLSQTGQQAELIMGSKSKYTILRKKFHSPLKNLQSETLYLPFLIMHVLYALACRQGSNHRPFD